MTTTTTTKNIKVSDVIVCKWSGTHTKKLRRNERMNGSDQEEHTMNQTVIILEMRSKKPIRNQTKKDNKVI